MPTLGPNRTIHLLTGVSGVGKSWVTSQFKEKAFTISWDKTRSDEARAAALVQASFQDKPILLEVTKLVSTTIKRNPDFKFKVFILTGTLAEIVERRRSRNGNVNEVRIMQRMRRMQSFEKRYNGYAGNQADMLVMLENTLVSANQN